MNKRSGRFFFLYMATIIGTVFSCNMPGFSAKDEAGDLRKRVQVTVNVPAGGVASAIRDLCDSVAKM
jgi:hypothetical protein